VEPLLAALPSFDLDKLLEGLDLELADVPDLT